VSETPIRTIADLVDEVQGLIDATGKHVLADDLQAVIDRVPLTDTVVADRLFDLRDYFAGQAIGALVANAAQYPIEVSADTAYRIADALLAERARPASPPKISDVERTIEDAERRR
jgi:hypothetical protein